MIMGWRTCSSGAWGSPKRINACFRPNLRRPRFSEYPPKAAIRPGIIVAKTLRSGYARTMLMRLWIAALLIVAPPLFAAQAREVVREQQNFMIAGVKEVWRLVWRGAPSESGGCGSEHAEGAMTCPCEGFAYAQVGDLVLERQRHGARPERMPLSPLFAESDMLENTKGPAVILTRWPARLSDIDDRPTSATIHARPPVRIMLLRDYNHDGIAGEFLLEVNAGPCGHRALVAVGITRDNPHLHALTTVEHPAHPLALSPSQWKALARNPRPGTLIDVSCGDHGADEQTAIALRAEHGRIHAIPITSPCPDGSF